MKRKFLILALLILPVIAFAQVPPTNIPTDGNIASPANPLNFNPPSTDVSVNYLANIFGVVDGVLHGSGSQILGQMFSVFNAAVLALGLIVVSYIYLVGTLQTAHEGELLGRKWSSSLIPIKMATGIGLIIPKATGYSFIQIFVMWVVVQGVGAADKIWDQALNYLQEGGVIVQQARDVTKSGPLLDASGSILKSEVCMFALRKHLVEQRQSAINAGQPAPAAVPDFSVLPALDGKSNSLSLPYLPNSGVTAAYSAYNGACGSVSWNVDQQESNQAAKGNGNGGSEELIKRLSFARSLAVKQIILDLAPYAELIVNNATASPSLPYGQFPVDSNGKPILDQWIGSTSPPLPPLLSGTILKDSVQDYNGIVFPYLNALYHEVGNSQKFTENARAQGWLTAGRYYFDLAQTNKNIASVTHNYPKASEPATGTNLCRDLGLMSGDRCSSDGTLINNLVNSAELSNYISNASKYQVSYGRQDPGTESKFAKFSVSEKGKITKAVINTIAPGFLGIAGGLEALFNAQRTNINPIVAVSTLGTGLINFVAGIWLGGAVALAALAAAIGAIPYITSSTGVIAALNWFMPLMSAVMIAMFVAGGTLAYYIPLIPFIVFTFTAIGWFVAVIESIVAAPIVALGIAHPERHEVFGMAEQGIFLIMNIFLRPSMMLFGYIAGIILSYVSIWILGATFEPAYKQLMTNVTGLAWLLGWLAMLFIFTGLVIALLNLSFSLIHVIPDKILRWIGGGVEQFGEYSRGGLEGAKGALAGGMRPAAEGMSNRLTRSSRNKSVGLEQGRQASQSPDDAQVTDGGSAGNGGESGGGGGASGAGGSASGAGGGASGAGGGASGASGGASGAGGSASGAGGGTSGEGPLGGGGGPRY